MRTSTATPRPGAEQVVTIRPLIPGRVLSDAERETVAAHERTFLAQPYGGMRERATRAMDARRAAARAIRVADPRKVRDRDGDVWGRQANGYWTLTRDAGGRSYGTSTARKTLQHLRSSFGPLEHLA